MMCTTNRRAAALAMTLLTACAGGSGGHGGEAAAAPLLVEVPAGNAVEGFAAGRLRKNAELAGFRITQHPVTRSEYESCVAAGVCAEPGHPGCDPKQDLGDLKVDGRKSPAVCVGVKNAHAFCRWIGGRLPRLSEWFYAARGVEPKLHAWGNEAAECAQHPRAQRLTPAVGKDDIVTTSLCAQVENEGKLEVDGHEAGASPLGVHDVLLTPAELLATEAEPLLSACHSAFAACAITGSQPGAIESLVTIRNRAPGEGPEPLETMPTYGFRCVLENE